MSPERGWESCIKEVRSARVSSSVLSSVLSEFSELVPSWKVQS